MVQLSHRDDVEDAKATLARERKDGQRRIDNLTAAIENGGEAISLVAKLRELETRRSAIDVEMAGLRPIPRLAPAVIENRLAEWRRLLRQSTTQARTVLQRVLVGRITFTPIVDTLGPGQSGYTFEAQTRFDRLFTGIATPRPKNLDSNRVGTEGIRPEETMDDGR